MSRKAPHMSDWCKPSAGGVTMTPAEIITEAKRTHARMVSAGHGDEADRGLFAVLFFADPDFRKRVETAAELKAALEIEGE